MINFIYFAITDDLQFPNKMEVDIKFRIKDEMIFNLKLKYQDTIKLRKLLTVFISKLSEKKKIL